MGEKEKMKAKLAGKGPTGPPIERKTVKHDLIKKKVFVDARLTIAGRMVLLVAGD